MDALPSPPSNVGTFALRHRPLASLLLPLLVVAVALIMIPAPGVGALSMPSLSAASSASTPGLTPAPTLAAHPSTPALHPGGLPGSSGHNAPETPGVSNSILNRFANYSLTLGQNSASTTSSPSSSPGTAAGASTASPGNRALPYIPTGTFNVIVANATNPSQYLSGVSVQAYPETGGQFCPAYLCSSVNTGPSGEVNVTCPVGPSYTSFLKGGWAENETFATCDLNQTVDLGTVYMLQDALVTGRVLGDISGFPPIPGVLVQGESRDYSILAEPEVPTSADGNFTVPIPPDVASRIDFTSPSNNFQNNFTFASGFPGQVVNIGIVYLEPNSLVEAKLYDAVTGQPITSVSSLTVCSSVTNVCGVQGAPSYNGVVEAVGTPGYDYVDAEGAYYMENQTPIGNVPGTSGDHAYCVPDNCRIYLTPTGAIQFTVELSGTPSSTWPTGLLTVSVCGLDGYELAFPKLNPVTYTYNTSLSDCIGSGCIPVGTTYQAPAFAYRNDIQIAPDTTGVCGFGPTWPIPGDLPVWGNESAANVTPYEVTNIGYLNITPGSYIDGNVYAAGTTSAPSSGFAIQIQSRIDTGLATYPYESGVTENACSGFGGGSTFFCDAAPPGPDQIIISSGSSPSNETWLAVPWQCCAQQLAPFSLGQVTYPSVQSANLTPEAEVNGSLVIQGGDEPVPYASVTVCPTSPTSTATCGEGLVNRTGGFSVTGVPSGWDVLHGSGSGYNPNSQWFYIGSGTVVLPPLPLTPLATLEGYVLSTNGSAIIDASIDACTLAVGVASQSCNSPLGSGLATTSGYYQGLVDGGWLPGATYEVEASAPGYESDWTWVNASSNATTVVPNLVLAPVGISDVALSPSGHAFSQGASAGSWVLGRLVDNSTGEGIEANGITGCSVASGVCTSFPDGSDSGGFFNDSLASGVYNLSIAADGYIPTTILLTVPSYTPVVNIGTIDLTPLPWVFGHTTTNWTTIEINASGFPTAHVPISAPVTVLGCGLYCGAATPDSTAGQFQTQAYYGRTDTLLVNPSYAGSYTSAPGGFNPAQVVFNDSTPTLNLTEVPITVLYVAVSGYISNAASCVNSSSTPVCSDPARWATVSVSTTGVNNGIANAVANGGGGYTCFVPGDNDQGATRVTAQDANFYYRTQEIVNAQLGAYPGWNLTWVANPMELTEYGFATVTVVSSSTGLPVVGTGISSSYYDPLNGNGGTTAGVTNGAGFANITAPSGSSVQFSIGTSNDFNNTSFSAPVLPGNTTDLNLVYSISGAPVPVQPWGWVEGQYLNYTAPVNFPGTIVDRANGLPLAGASVTISSADSAIVSGGSTESSNGLGEFLADAPIGPADTLVVELSSYQLNTTSPVNITPGVQRVFPQIKLTGDGVLASQVIAEPSGTPVAAATVTVCAGTGTSGSGQSDCVNVITNATGYYWVNVKPGPISITVSASGYVSNYTELAKAVSDTWTAIPAFEVVQDGILVGTVRGLPTGLPVGSALVSACSPQGGVPTGPCNFQVTALSNGNFHLPVAPSTYVLATSAAGFNTSYLPVSVQPGETVDLGIVLVTEFGILTGEVVNSVTGLAVPNAMVGGCPVDTLLPCDSPTPTDLDGSYHVASPPGTVNLVVSATGYLDGYLRANAVSGTTVSLPVITIAPIVNESTVHVSGHVVMASSPATPIPGATVGLWAGSSLAASADVGSTGEFEIGLPSGTYTLVATAPGYSAYREPLTLEESVAGLVLPLGTFGWSVSGTVRDGLTNASIPSVAIWSTAGLVAMTNSTGAFSASLPNGTYNFTAIAGGAAASIYAPVGFQLQVAASSVSRSVWLYPAALTLSGAVENSANQSAIVGAQVTVRGTAVDGAARVISGTTDSNGRFSLPMVYFGSYTLTVSAPGYRTATLSETAGISTPGLAVDLTPVATTSTGTPISDWSYTFLALALVGGAVVLVAVLGRRGRAGGSP